MLKKTALYTFFYKNVVFPAQAEFSYFSADCIILVYILVLFLKFSLRHFRLRNYLVLFLLSLGSVTLKRKNLS